MLTRWSVAVAVLMGAVAGVGAQVPSDSDGPEAARVRQKIFMMEGVLERAVQLGVDNLRRRAGAVLSDDTLLQGGVPVVRGFRLEGYGLFFDVEVPALRRSIAWSLRTINQTGMALAQDLAQMRAILQSIADPNVRAEFDRALVRIQQQVGPASLTTDGGASFDQVAAPQGMPQAPDQPAVGEAMSEVVVPEVDAQLLDDPGGAYMQEVQAALLAAVVENSGPLVLDDNEWLTIAARDKAPGNPLMTGDPDARTLVLRVTGEALNGFHSGRLTGEQLRSQVEVGEF